MGNKQLLEASSNVASVITTIPQKQDGFRERNYMKLEESTCVRVVCIDWEAPATERSMWEDVTKTELNPVEACTQIREFKIHSANHYTMGPQKQLRCPPIDEQSKLLGYSYTMES